MIVNGEKCEKVNGDDGFFFGKGVFETIMIYDEPLFIDNHLQRLNEGARKLKIHNEVKKDHIMNAICENHMKNTVMKVVLTDRNVVITSRKNPYTDEMYETGFKVKVSGVRRNSTSMLPYVKSVCYVENILEREKAKEEGFDEVIFLNEKDELTEGSASNIFFIKAGQIFTPSLNCGLLNGVIRDWVIDNFQVREGKFHLDDLRDAEGAFLTNSLMGIMKINAINGQPMCCGNIADEVSKKYQGLTGFKLEDE